VFGAALVGGVVAFFLFDFRSAFVVGGAIAGVVAGA
jgi:hypothetical protein